jgi:8-oxo-dGTP pyrophosphatase MutT (NUDIX family)
VKIETVRRKLASHRPERVELADPAYASVAVVLREGPRSAEVLLIERAIREGDPWSGHMAFPGGRLDEGDHSTLGAAQRETFEEVGVELGDAEVLGQLDEMIGNPRINPRLVIAAHAFHLERATDFVLDEREVQDAFWFPLADLHDEARHVEHAIPELPEMRFPGIVVGQPDRHVVWGLTYRFLDRMLALLGSPLPDRWGDLSRYAEDRRDASPGSSGEVEPSGAS